MGLLLKQSCAIDQRRIDEKNGWKMSNRRRMLKQCIIVQEDEVEERSKKRREMLRLGTLEMNNATCRYERETP